MTDPITGCTLSLLVIAAGNSVEGGDTLMPAPRVLPDNEELLQLRQAGLTYDEIATRFGVTKGAVYLQLRRVKATGTRPTYKHLLPWRVKAEHTHAHPAMMLRLLARRQNGEELPDAKARLLDKWLHDVSEADVVVCYEPDFPPNDASPTSGGFYYSRRREGDGDALIRHPDAEPVEVGLPAAAH